MTKEQARTLIDREFATAGHATKTGNEGMVRVCARRAAGVAISLWLQTHPDRQWGHAAITQIRNVADDGSLPQTVRDAARRLTTKVTTQFTSPVSTDPVSDSNIIIRHFMERI